MCDAISVNGMRPVIDRAFAFDQAKAAFSYMESGAHFGWRQILPARFVHSRFIQFVTISLGRVREEQRIIATMFCFKRRSRGDVDSALSSPAQR